MDKSEVIMIIASIYWVHIRHCSKFVSCIVLSFNTDNDPRVSSAVGGFQVADSETKTRVQDVHYEMP